MFLFEFLLLRFVVAVEMLVKFFLFVCLYFFCFAILYFFLRFFSIFLFFKKKNKNISIDSLLLVDSKSRAKADGDRNELMKGGGGGAGEQTRDQMLDKAERIQKEDLSAVDRMKSKVAEAQEIGAETAEKMHGQMGQLAGTTERLDEQRVLLQQGSKQLRAFARRIATDKIIMGCLCIVVLIVAILIVLDWLAPDTVEGIVNVPDELSIPEELFGSSNSTTAD